MITVAVGGLWLFVKAVYIDPFVDYKKHAAANIMMDRISHDAEANAKRVLSDPNSSDEHKKEVQKIVEDVRTLRLKKIIERMEVVAAPR